MTTNGNIGTLHQFRWKAAVGLMNSGSNDNRRRAFAEVISVDAWHDAFVAGRATADLHADVVFRTARLGSEPESAIRFRLGIRRAEFMVVIPHAEPLEVNKRKVSRDNPMPRGQITEIVESSTSSALAAKVSGKLTHVDPQIALNFDGGGSSTRRSSKKLQRTSEYGLQLVTQSLSSEGHYQWLIEAADSDVLMGRPWNADTSRLQLIDKRTDRTRSLPPTVRVEVQCRREDLAISGLEVKDKNLWRKIQARLGFENRLAAAEAYIQTKLVQEGLSFKHFEDKFGQVSIAAVTAEPLS